MASIRAQNAKMSELTLKSLENHAPSKLRVAGSNPAGVANDFNRLKSARWMKLLDMCGHFCIAQRQSVTAFGAYGLA